MKKKKPSFKRQEQFKHPRLKKKWRRPRGRHSKLRIGEKPRGKKPSPGYGAPRSLRGLNPQGLKEVRVFTPSQLEPLSGVAVIIGASVGKKKRELIVQKAKEKNLPITNI